MARPAPDRRAGGVRATRPAIVAVAFSAVVIVAAVVLVAVLDGRHGGGGEPVSSLADLSGQAYTVGGKDDSEEQEILCRMTAEALRAARAGVTERCRTGSTDVTRGTLLRGDIDVYWEYTGTAWRTFLRETRTVTDPTQLYDLVRDRDARQNGIVWTAPAPFDNTYAFAVNGDRARELGIATLSDMARYVASGRSGRLCVEPEYRTRQDGLVNLQRAYGFRVPPARLRVLPAGDVYQATRDGSCLFGEVYTTDGRIPGLGLAVLSDDRGYHPIYNPAPTLRRDVVDRAPDVTRVLDALAVRLDYRTVVTLNGEVTGQGRDPSEVARRWLADTGLVP